MKKWFSYLFYIAVTLIITYGFHWILVLLIGSIRFTAADGPPGDIHFVTKLIFSIGIPLFYFTCITIVFFLYRFILQQFAIELKKVIPITFNLLITLYLMASFYSVVFDL